ncbi:MULTISPECIES: RrF2 family transcriptional regulator [unclassified Micromonospora]|uniref:RrF2 family transcriptional regulator n=1 Tax=unclassified Micromonospora TaxID=2617518 RepID=UPI00362684BE
MRMSQGVEWALHTCLNLTYVGQGEAVPTSVLAKFYALPAAYLNKHLQALVRAGILASTPGPRGGFRLARRAESITLLDVVTAIEGPGEAFPCDQILREGPGGSAEVDYREACVIARSMRRADLAWRRELASRTLVDVRSEVEARYPDTPQNTRGRFAALRA